MGAVFGTRIIAVSREGQSPEGRDADSGRRSRVWPDGRSPARYFAFMGFQLSSGIFISLANISIF
jgi:hypothetical protein